MSVVEQVAVLDPGSWLIKAGIPGDLLESPSVVTSSAVNDNRGGPSKHAIVEGDIVDWQAFEPLLDDILYKKLGWKQGQEGSLLVTEPIFSRRATRERLTKLLFEHNNISSLLICDSASLSLYAVGRLSGLTVDIGYAKTDAAAVVDGQLIAPSACRIDRGMRDVHEAMRRIVQNSGQQVNDPVALDAKCHELLGVWASSEEALATPIEGESGHTCRLPDGQEITLGPVRLQPGEDLISPSSSGASSSLAYHLNEARQAVQDQNIRKTALEHLLVCGGGACLEGLPQRILRDFNSCLPPSTTCALYRQPDFMPENTPQFAAWLGGAVLVKALAQPAQFLTKQEYKESGARAIYKRCI